MEVFAFTVNQVVVCVVHAVAVNLVNSHVHDPIVIVLVVETLELTIGVVILKLFALNVPLVIESQLLFVITSAELIVRVPHGATNRSLFAQVNHALFNVLLHLPSNV